MLRTTVLTTLVCVAVVICGFGLPKASLQTDSIRRVTNTPEEKFNINPCLSGDGHHVAFESTADLTGSGGENGFRAYRASLASEPAAFTELGLTRAITCAASQDGESIVFASKDNPLGTNGDGNSEIFIYSSSQLRQVTNTLPADATLRHVHGNFQPSLTDDGRTIAFASNRQLTGQNGDANLEIFTFDTLTNTFTQLTTSSGTVGAMDAKISGDGSHISYIRDNGITPSTQRDLMLEDLSTSESVVIGTNINALALANGRAISDDGLRVVYASETGTDTSQIFLYDGRNHITRQLTSLSARADDVPLHASISGDGKRISFATRRNVIGGNSDNSAELYTYDLSTGHFARVTSAPTTATADVISSLNDDGSLVAFNFARVLSGTVSTASLANNSEIYVATTEVRPPYSSNILIQNGASFGHEPSTFEAVAPDSIAVAFGNSLAFETVEAQPLPNGNYPTVLGGTTVSINQRLVQLFSISPTHVVFHVPIETATTFAQIVVTNSEGFQTRGTIRILQGSPGLFTESGDGVGTGVITDAETGQTGPFDPTNGARHLIVHATGVRGAASQTQAMIGGRVVPLVSVEASTQTPGLDLLHIELPRDLRGAGSVSLTVRAGRRESNPVTMMITGNPERAVFINEVLADPPDGIMGDANHDGVRSGTDDEFVELVNAESNDVDVSGWTVRTHSVGSTNETTRHVFAAGTIIPASDALVIFGGGNFDPANPVFGGSHVVSTSSAGLSLTNGGLTVLVRDAAGHLIAEFSYGGTTGLDGNANQSLTRSPDIFGDFLLHTLAPYAAGRPFSPGTLLDGSFFVPHDGHITRVTTSPDALDAIVGQRVQVVARAFDQFGRPSRHAAISFTSSNPAITTLESVRVARILGIATATFLCVNSGMTNIRATATDGSTAVTSNPSIVTVSPAPPVITRVEVSPGSQTINRGNSTQFNARAFDIDNTEVKGVVFQWSSSDPPVGTVNQEGMAHGTGIGRTTITATAANGTGGFVSGEATLSVEIPLVINEVLADVAPDNPATPDIEGDANRDGVRDSADDEFVELLNTSHQPVDISGVVIADMTSNRYTFPPNTHLSPGRSVIVFGGGSPRSTDPSFGGSIIFTASSLGLNDSGDAVQVKLPVAGMDVIVAEVAFGAGTPIPAPSNQSLTRSPDAEINQNGGEFVGHLLAHESTGRIYSPGTRTEGTSFGSTPVSRLEIFPSSATIDIGESQQFVARAFTISGGSEVELSEVSFIWDSDDPSKSTLAPSTGATTTAYGLAAGMVIVRARAGGQQAIATLTINPPPQVLTRIDVVPATAAIIVGGTKQFDAHAFDQNNVEIPGVVFTWNSTDATVATIDQNGLATGLAVGVTEIRAAAATVTSAPVSLSVTVPQVPMVGQVIINEALVSFTAGTPTRTDFLELLNTTNLTLDLSGLVISFRASGSTSQVITVSLPGSVGSGTTLLPPNSYYLIANGPSTFGVVADFNASTPGFDLNNSSGAIKIEINGLKLDGVRYQQNGSATPPPVFDGFGEGTLFTFAGGTPNDLIRSPNGIDTDNNANDFRRNNSHATVSPKAANPTLP